MITRSEILSILPTYKGLKIEQVKNQKVTDIMQAIKECHKEYAEQYDLIAPYFVGRTVEQTCKNIFNFLRDNTKYYQEPTEVQTVQSPAAIIATGKIKGIDCKNYSLFAGGILDAINRLGLQKIPFVYRFVSDKIYTSIPGHVFIVANPGTNKEFWIDPIPQIDCFNQKWMYYYSTDKKISGMSLYKVSGVTRMERVGVIDAATATAIFNTIKSLFSGKGSPNDWQGWERQERDRNLPIGTSAQHWTINNGDNPKNEALNVIRWIENYGLNTVLNFNSYLNRTVTIDDLARKLNAAGYNAEANELIARAKQLPAVVNPSVQKAGTNAVVTIAVIGAALYFLTRNN